MSEAEKNVQKISVLAVCLSCRSMFDGSSMKWQTPCPECGQAMELWISPEGVIDAFDLQEGEDV